VTAGWYAHLAQTQLLHLFQHALVSLVARIPPPELRQHIVARPELLPVRLLIFRALASFGVRLQEYVEERGDGRIGLCGADRGAARGAGVRVYRRRGRGLESEPFLQAGAAEGVQAVEQCERLVEEVGTDLSRVKLAGASSSTRT
jgi:hypothetical protein